MSEEHVIRVRLLVLAQITFIPKVVKAVLIPEDPDPGAGENSIDLRNKALRVARKGLSVVSLAASLAMCPGDDIALIASSFVHGVDVDHSQAVVPNTAIDIKNVVLVGSGLPGPKRKIKPNPRFSSKGY